MRISDWSSDVCSSDLKGTPPQPSPAFAGEGAKLAASAAPARAGFEKIRTTMTELAFRNATAADVAAIVPLATSAYRGDASPLGWTTEANFLDGNRHDPDVLPRPEEHPSEPQQLIRSSSA